METGLAHVVGADFTDFTAIHAMFSRNFNMNYARWAAITWTAAIFLACWFPSDRLSIKESSSHTIMIPHADKIVHFSLFTIFSILWVRLGSDRHSLIMIVLSGVVIATLSEVGQAHPWVNRDPDLFDVIADFLGLLTGVAIGLMRSPYCRLNQRVT